MTRARARALETEVTSLLSLRHFDSHENWLLPSSETLCILRHLGSNHGEVKEQEGSKEEKNSRYSANPDDPDEVLNDPAEARMIRTDVRTIRQMCPKTPEAPR